MLPIYAIESRLVDHLRNHNRLVLSAPTGSGKTTQVPQILLKHLYPPAAPGSAPATPQRILVLQPRRLAVRMVAQRVAQEMKTSVGELVGYQTRHDNRVSDRSLIRFMTEGLFLRMLSTNPKLNGIAAVVLDEFHERHLATDTALGLVKRLQESTRPDLRLIVMSATLETRRIADYLGCEALESEGRMYPVDIRYLDGRSSQPCWELAADAVIDIIDREPEGDLLIFMPGSYEIRRTIETCRAIRTSQQLNFFPLYSELPVAQQDAALAPFPGRKIIVSTNVAETSITIEGVAHVIDSGLARINRFDARRGINVLLIEPISQSSAQQRAGRAGRTGPGTCTRLWPANEHKSRPGHDTPEVQRLDLAEVVLQLKSLGIHDLSTFPWLEAPDPQSLEKANQLLVTLNAMTPDGVLTPQGREMARLPMHPRLSKMLTEAAHRGCLPRAALWAAMISERDILIRGQKNKFGESDDERPMRTDFAVLERAFFSARASDFEMHRCAAVGVNALACRELDKTHRLFLDAVGIRHGDALGPVREGEEPGLIQCLLAGFPDHLALRRNESNLSCQLADQRRGELDPASVAKAPGLVLPVEIREVSAGNQGVKTVLSMASQVDPVWVEEMFPDDVQRSSGPAWNQATRMVEAVERSTYRGLSLTERIRLDPDRDEAARILADLVIDGTLKLEGWDEKVDRWIVRARCVAEWFPEKKLLKYDPDDIKIIIQEICTGAVRYGQIKEKPCLQPVRDAMSWDEQQFIEKMAPERLTMPTGKWMQIEYQPGQRPRGSAKIQELYDLTQTPMVAAGRQKLLLEILGPNYRPVQVTDDLPGFWKNLYPTLKKELSRKYPRHEWR